ncbi:HEPN domain-containing protein [Azospirillum picis]|uniref:HEPN domain-containing protein n=1 Tax=Azospirillum picis TaxID=488438 RepID=A0ABU0MFC2_9PROT|nr:HEPN domain-containing protein [Azospirillum picis]MBP2298108.1 hypothetical protein [Azospirillum picis]MDQ0531946.1 hypothetical protein [Azospirillum picis]
MAGRGGARFEGDPQQPLWSRAGAPDGSYHCQQAVEKLAKTLLVAAGMMPPKSHDIDVLVARLPTGHPLAPRIAGLAHLTAFISASRYPGAGIFDDPLPDLPISEVVGWLADIDALRSDILRFLGQP